MPLNLLNDVTMHIVPDMNVPNLEFDTGYMLRCSCQQSLNF